MANALRIVAVLAVVVVSLSANALPSSKSTNQKITAGKVFLIGGGTEDSTSSIYNALRESTGKFEPRIAVVISAAPSLADGLDAYYVPDSTKSYEQLFTDYGYKPSVVRLAKDNYEVARTLDTPLGLENINLIRNADIIFFNGGDQSRHSRCWLNDDGSDSEIMTILRARYLEGSVVIAGTSAGAAAQGTVTYGEGVSYGYYKFNADLKPCAIGETFDDDREGNNSERYMINGGYMPGLGFLENGLVDTHFDARGRFVRLPAAMKNVGKTYGFGVDEDTALYVNKDRAVVYGNSGVWMMDNSGAKYSDWSGHFAVDGVKIAYLTEGDSLDWTGPKVVVTSTKPIITELSGTAYQSNAIFAADEAIKTMESLVSYTQLFTFGFSKDKKPACRIIFYKNATLGYRSDIGFKYTIDNIYLDVETI